MVGNVGLNLVRGMGSLAQNGTRLFFVNGGSNFSIPVAGYRNNILRSLAPQITKEFDTQVILRSTAKKSLPNVLVDAVTRFIAATELSDETKEKIRGVEDKGVRTLLLGVNEAFNADLMHIIRKAEQQNSFVILDDKQNRLVPVAPLPEQPLLYRALAEFFEFNNRAGLMLFERKLPNSPQVISPEADVHRRINLFALNFVEGNLKTALQILQTLETLIARDKPALSEHTLAALEGNKFLQQTLIQQAPVMRSVNGMCCG